MEDVNSDKIVEKWIHENDDSKMPLPDIESEPHLLISKVSIKIFILLVSKLLYYLKHIFHRSESITWNIS